MPFEIVEIDAINGLKFRQRSFDRLGQAVDHVMTEILHTNMTREMLEILQHDDSLSNIWVVEDPVRKRLVEVDPRGNLPIYDILAKTFDWKNIADYSIYPLFPDQRHAPSDLFGLRHYLAGGSHIHPGWYDRAPGEIYVTTTEQEDAKELYECDLNTVDPYCEPEELEQARKDRLEVQIGTLNGNYIRGYYETHVIKPQ